MQMGVGGVKFSRKKRYEGVRSNVIGVTRGWVGVQFPGKKRYVTLEWPLTSKYLGTFDKNSRNRSRKKKQRKPMTKMQENNITDSEIHVLLWQQQAEWRRTGIYFSETSRQRYNNNFFPAETSIFVG